MTFPPPPGQEPQQPPPWSPPSTEEQHRPWPDPVWGAPPPRRSSTGLIVTLSVVGGLVGLLLIVGVMAATLGGASHSSAERRTPAVTPPGSGTPATEPAPPAQASPDPGAEESSPEADVTLSKCAIDSLTHWPSVLVKITNGTAAPASYIVSVEFVNGSGTRVAEGIASTSALAPGQTSKQKAQGLGEVSADTKCKVSQVSRFPEGR